MAYEKGVKAIAGRVKPADSGQLTVGPQNPYLFVPMETKGRFEDGSPVNSLMVKTRGALLDEWYDGDVKNGNFGAIYTSYLYSILAFAGVLLFYGINIYVAAVFAYLAGMFWSKVLIAYAWSAVWFRGKPLISTK